MSVSIGDVIQCIEAFAPPRYQESYDNAGLLVGDAAAPVTGVLICLDSTEAVVDEAIRLGCNLIVAHHPLVFSGLKRFTGKTYIERVVMSAIRNSVAIYAAHTNLDNVAAGVNARIAERIGLLDTKVLAPKRGLLRKLVTFAPEQKAEDVRQALFGAGAGHISRYDACSFNVNGTGTFRAGEGANPAVGQVGVLHYEPETRIEVIFPFDRESVILKALFEAHPYEEVAYDIYNLENQHNEIGSGLIGRLPEPMDPREFLLGLKSRMQTEVIRHTRLLDRKVEKIAVCGGSGSFLLSDARRQGADVLVTADFKYHQFFDAEDDIIIADIGHYESEQFTGTLFQDLIRKNFTTFAVRLTEVRTNPVHYL
jgi:dinuclear metal center YbgI/SA1388 family protein